MTTRDLGQAVEQDGADAAPLHGVFDEERDFGDFGSIIEREVPSYCDNLFVRLFTVNDDKSDVAGPVNRDQLIKERFRK